MPPFTTVVVKVTASPAQILFRDMAMLTAGTTVFTVIEILLLVAVAGVAHIALLVSVQLT